MGKMKVLISMSGGFDSTYLLWKTLEETDHEVHVIHVELDTISRRVIPENRASVAIEKWMKSNCRPIKSWVNGSVTIDWKLVVHEKLCEETSKPTQSFLALNR